MKKYKIGNTSFEAENLVAPIEYVKTNRLTGAMVRVKSGIVAAPTKVNTDRPVVKTLTSDRQIVTITCGWGNNAHSWTTTKGDAVQFRNCCPDHRN